MVTRVARYLPEHNGIPQHNNMPQDMQQHSGILEQKGMPERAGMPQQKGMPHELACHDVSGAAGHVRVTPGRPAALAADWFGGGRAEVMAAGRPLVVERDHDGMGVRIVEPMSGLPLAGFDPTEPAGLRRATRAGRRRGRNSGGRPGRVHLADGSTLRWVSPTRSVFECGFVRGWANIVRFAHDGTAIVCVGDDGASSGYPAGPATAPPDVLALVVLGWFLLLDAGWPLLGDHAGELAGGAAYADRLDGLDGAAASGRVPPVTAGLPSRPRAQVRGWAVARPAPPVR